MGRKPQKTGETEAEILRILLDRFGVSGMTYEKLGEKTGVPRATVQKTLTGKRASTVEELVAIARALGLKLSDVIEQAEARLESTTPTLSAVPELAEETPFQRNQRLYANVDTSIPEDLSRLAALDPNLE